MRSRSQAKPRPAPQIRPSQRDAAQKAKAEKERAEARKEEERIRAMLKNAEAAEKVAARSLEKANKRADALQKKADATDHPQEKLSLLKEQLELKKAMLPVTRRRDQMQKTISRLKGKLGQRYGHTGPAYGHTGPAYGHTGQAYGHTGKVYRQGPACSECLVLRQGQGPRYTQGKGSGPSYTHCGRVYTQGRPEKPDKPCPVFTTAPSGSPSQKAKAAVSTTAKKAKAKIAAVTKMTKAEISRRHTRAVSYVAENPTVRRVVEGFLLSYAASSAVPADFTNAKAAISSIVGGLSAANTVGKTGVNRASVHQSVEAALGTFVNLNCPACATPVGIAKVGASVTAVYVAGFTGVYE